ncbi:uncharacterized protein L201_002622 [Kwoniella dendrophila CBS 6074]|uniref:Uncharacterized protein n=1 Tax=Kwoniella dendrophila CBS 6074 TaxID=1295534 RepID=A0AAX4JQN6_9TREE
MDRQLKSPLLIETIGESTKLKPEITYQHLLNFLSSSSSFGSNNNETSVTKIQLERLTDALGVSIGKINYEEEEKREIRRKELRLERKLERRRLRAEQQAQVESLKNQENLSNLVEGLVDDVNDNQDDAEMENGATQFDDDKEEKLNDRGDVEYGDVVNEDDDEPDNDDAGEDQDEKMESD